MANGKDDKYDGQEEGEYHFSDEHTAYEMDTDTVKVSDAATIKESPFAHLGKYRRLIIAAVVFFSLMVVIYKMLAPGNGNAVPTTDIAQQATPAPKPTVAAVKEIDQSVTPPAPAVSAPPSAPVIAVTSPPPAAAPPQPQQVAPAPAEAVVVAQMPPPPPPPMVITQQPPTTVPAPELTDRLASVEQQSAKLANVMQIEYAQKMTDYDNQAVAMQAKLKEMNARIANMEAALNQITQALQGSARPVALSPNGMPATKTMEPKQIYTVQAIIPGRAWLKSEAGDTVTVAEGDVLRDYGRVTKIDPYDGVVNIDTGNKMISLSYGSGGD